MINIFFSILKVQILLAGPCFSTQRNLDKEHSKELASLIKYEKCNNVNFEKIFWSDIDKSNTQEKFNIIHDTVLNVHDIFLNQNINNANKLLEDIKEKENLFQEGRGFSLIKIAKSLLHGLVNGKFEDKKMETLADLFKRKEFFANDNKEISSLNNLILVGFILNLMPKHGGKEYLEDQRKYDGHFDVENKDYNQHWMETTHDFIQWWFPTSKKGMDENAPLMTKDLAQLIKQIPEEYQKIIQNEIRSNFKVMMRFWGQDVIDEGSYSTSIKKIEGKKGEEGEKNFLENSHNYKRASRVKESLRLFNLSSEYYGFNSFLSDIYEKNKFSYPELKKSYQKYW